MSLDSPDADPVFEPELPSDAEVQGTFGFRQALAKVRGMYGVTAEKQGTGDDYAMAHTSSIFLIDRTGKLRGMMPFGHKPDDFVHDVRMLLDA